VAALLAVPAGRDPAALRGEVEVVDRAALADDPVLAVAADPRGLVVVVRVVCADLRGLVDRTVQRRGERVRVLEEVLSAARVSRLR